MKEYKSKYTTMMFETVLGLCAGWFVCNIAGRIFHSFLSAVICAVITFAFFFFKIFYADFISIILTDDRKLVVKRFNRIINVFEIDKYYWSEYPKDSKTKDESDQDIYYVSKETGKEDYIDLSNFKGQDYKQLLDDLCPEIKNDPPVKVETIKK